MFFLLSSICKLDLKRGDNAKRGQILKGANLQICSENFNAASDSGGMKLVMLLRFKDDFDCLLLFRKIADAKRSV